MAWKMLTLEVVICAPFTHLDRLNSLKSKGIIYWVLKIVILADKGAYTEKYLPQCFLTSAANMYTGQQRRNLDTVESIP